jgi:NADH-quinone oxidoreductase subunit J
VRDLHLRLPQGVPVLGGPTVNLETATFILLAAAAVAAGILALLTPEIVHTIIWIGALFVVLGLIYFLLAAPFLGVLQLAVYAGAVTILFLFAVMVIKKRIFAREVRSGVGPVPLLLAAAVAGVLVTLAAQVPARTETGGYPVSILSQNLFGLNGAWLLLLGFLMVSALAGSIHLAREMRTARRPKGVPP